ncbi:hypothetical protein EYZ11_009916 [Aspergillus tanneri]|uniref:Uncharacterized protein n=1 Tax=Aspergillus tanneri TaxID=1220188 RepID=A0A4S3J8S5_9EURO|nr:hypothetical protein EYZ11_009916 [Aspergillus tanneri]
MNLNLLKLQSDGQALSETYREKKKPISFDPEFGQNTTPYPTIRPHLSQPPDGDRLPKFKYGAPNITFIRGICSHSIPRFLQASE